MNHWSVKQGIFLSHNFTYLEFQLPFTTKVLQFITSKRCTLVILNNHATKLPQTLLDYYYYYVVLYVF
jgi:hypothetical protein